MAIEYITSPFKTLGASTVRWVSIANDVFFRVRRKDFAVTGATNSGGNTSLTIAAATVPVGLTVGSRVWVSLLSGREGYYTLISNTSSTIVINLPWVASSTGIVNLYDDFADYILTVQYQYSDDAGATWTTHAYSEHQMSPVDFEAPINISPWVNNLVTAGSKSHPAATKNDAAGSLDRLIKILWSERYVSVIDGEVVGVPHTTDNLYILNSAMQLQYVNGVNLKEFLTNAVPDQTFKFISDFVKATYFKDMPFAMYFIYSELMTNGAIDMVEDEYSGTVNISTQGYALDVTKIGKINRYFLQEVGTSYNSNSDIIRINAKIHGGAALSEIRHVKYDPCAKRNVVYLKWLGKGGGWNYWLFEKKQILSDNVTAEQGEFSQFIEDISTADTDSDYVTKECTPEMTVYADMLDSNDLTGLNKIKHSPKVQMLMNPTTWKTDATRDVWQTVKIVPGRFKSADTKATFGGVEFTFRLTELFIQTN